MKYINCLAHFIAERALCHFYINTKLIESRLKGYLNSVKIEPVKSRVKRAELYS